MRSAMLSLAVWVSADRPTCAALGGGCQVPIGALACVEDGRLRMIAVVASPDGGEVIRATAEGAAADAEKIGGALGEELLKLGARRILEAVGGR